MDIWLKVFFDATSSQKSKYESKIRSNVRNFSRNVRRMFIELNLKRSKIVSYLLDQIANVTHVNDRIRFLIISLENSKLVTKYCTLVDRIFRIHKSRLSEQTDCELDLNSCKVSFSKECTRDVQAALINEQIGTIFIHYDQAFVLLRRESLNHSNKNATNVQQERNASNETYDRPKPSDNRTSVDRNNDYLSIMP
ncbi:unnamed protein product [Rotaria sp. Silwood2]|nr:unnamed protein product [Rotaria sp. Silwood2]CAF4404410.1 unnamed protein product [Rotaria sp. Silwood2]